jgi:hypothetical protein
VAAAAMMVLLVHRPEDVREKGGPVVTVFIKRGPEVFPWDGAARLRPEDRLRLRLAPAGYDHVSVASLGDDRSPEIIYDGEVRGASLLPVSFRVSADGRRERMSVILGHGPLSPDLHRSIEEGDRQGVEAGRDLWHTLLVFEKEPTARSAP